jgi:uncharacterized membrane protein YdcZ (DUF606 family)
LRLCGRQTPGTAGFSRCGTPFAAEAPLGGIIGAFAVVAGLLFVGTIGAGTYAALTVSANLLMSLLIDHFGWLRVPPHPITLLRAVGAVVLVTGVILITKNQLTPRRREPTGLKTVGVMSISFKPTYRDHL